MDQKTPSLSLDVVDYAKQKLENHPVYSRISSITELRIFMEHHVYSVWDFMSLIKFLHVRVQPVDVPWVPHGNTPVRRFINELLMEEESDEAPADIGFDGDYISHFELYCIAMEEVGANPGQVLNFIEQIRTNGIQKALSEADIPEPSRTFSRQTFEFIETGKPHIVGSALAFGREHIIPWMFRSILRDIGISEKDAPAFYYYLNRHIHLDAFHHGPLSIKLVEALCDNSHSKIEEAEQAARTAVDARVKFWDELDAVFTG